MKARLVTNDGCEKIVDAIIASDGEPTNYHKTVSYSHPLSPIESSYGLPDGCIGKVHIYILVGYDYLITSKHGHREKRAVYWEE